MKNLILILLFIPVILKAQEPRPGNLSPSLARGGITTLSKEWKYKAGDNPEWANPDFNDSSWQMFTNANLYNKEVQEKTKKINIVWYRKRICIDSTTTRKLVAYISQSGASEIYLDGELILSLGKVSSNPDSIVRYNPSVYVPLSFPMKINKEQVLAVRFADTKKKFSMFQENAGLLTIQVQKEYSPNDPKLIANDSLFNSNGIIHLALRNGWRFHPGDNLNWADPGFNDSNWMNFAPTMFTEPIPDTLWNGYGWFRLRFEVDSSVYEKVTHLYFSTWGAAEVYLDGKLVQKCGVFSTDPATEKLYNPYFKTHPALVLQQNKSHVLAVRFSYHKVQLYKKLLGKYAGGFVFAIGLATDKLNQLILKQKELAWKRVYILSTMLFVIVFMHGLLFIMFPVERSNLYIAIIVTLMLFTIIISYVELLFEPDILFYNLMLMFTNFLVFVIAAMIPFSINSIFKLKPLRMYKLIVGIIMVFALANSILSGPDLNPVILVIVASIVLFLSSKVLYRAWKNRQKGVWILAVTFLILILSEVVNIFYIKFSPNFSFDFHNLIFYLMFSSVPFGLTVLMASRFRDLYLNLEQKVAERTSELKKSMEDLKSAEAQLIQSEKMASLGQLTAGIAHEIQNPLNFVNNFSEVSNELVDEMREELAVGNNQLANEIAVDIKQNLEKINHHGKRADSIVKGMLQHSRANTGHKEPTDINALADEYLRLAYHGMRAKDKSFNAEFKTDFSPNLPKINVVPQDIGRVLLNLINNAFYAVDKKAKEENPLPPKGGSEESGKYYKPLVTVSTISSKSPSGDSRLNDAVGQVGVKVVVKDNGHGIPMEIKDKIFQPFFTTKPTGQGTGLGLSLSYDIVKAHGGEIKVNTKENEGTEFIIQLPIS